MTELPTSIVARHQYEFDEKCVPPNPEIGHTDYDETVEGLQCAATQFGWPVDRVPNDADLEQLVSALPEAQNASFERGWAYMMVSGVHSCQWMLAWIDASVDDDQDLRSIAEYWLVEIGPDYSQMAPDYPTDLLADSRGSRLALARSVRAGDIHAVRDRTKNCLDFKKDQGYAPVWHELIVVDSRLVVR